MAKEMNAHSTTARNRKVAPPQSIKSHKPRRLKPVLHTDFWVRAYSAHIKYHAMPRIVSNFKTRQEILDCERSP